MKTFLFYNRASLCSVGILIGLWSSPQTLWSQGNTQWGSVTPPSSETVLLNLGSLGSITKAQWTGSNTLAHTEQVLHMASLDFSQSDDYELKIAYVFQDPFDLENQLEPAVCKEVCYYVTCTNPSSSECQGEYQRFCEPIMGQFNFVSHLAAKYGAVMATNGAFYDYFYKCVPGVKSYVKVDRHLHSTPNVLNHRNEGALAFDFNGSTPRIGIFKRTATTLQQLDQGKIYADEVDTYPNVMSGGHLYEDGSPYQITIPAYCDTITYPWTNDPVVKTNILSTGGAEWRNFACPTFSTPVPETTPFHVALTPTKYGYQNFFQCADLNNMRKRQQFTCIDYAKYNEEFGSTSGLAKHSRTFIGLKNGKFYWFVVDGCKTKINNGQSNCRGFTVDDINGFAKKLKLDKTLNFDGGSSSVFYLNGCGILQFQYDPNAPAHDVKIGPQGQRLLQSVLMLVPKQKPLNQVYADEERTSYARVVNGTDAAKASFIDLSPALPKINTKLPTGLSKVKSIYGKFRLSGSGEGQIILSIVKDQNRALREALMVGAGTVPAQLLELLTHTNDKMNDGTLTIKRHKSLLESSYNDFKSAIQSPALHYWAFKVKGGQLVAFDVYNTATSGSLKNKWHTFMLTGVSAEDTSFNLYIDKKQGGNLQAQISGIESALDLHVDGATHCVIGATLLSGKYITKANTTLDVQDFVFSHQSHSQAYPTLSATNWTSALNDPMHTVNKAGTNASTIFCLDEKLGSKLAYAWYKNGNIRQLKAYGTYVNNAKSIALPSSSSVVQVVDCANPLPASGWERTRQLYYCPSQYPNFTIISMHRGLWVGDVPENSLPAIESAVNYFNQSQHKADFIELDIMPEKGGKTMFLFHDYGLDRLTTGKGPIKKQIGPHQYEYKNVAVTYNQIKNYDLKKEGKTYPGVHIPTLRQALQAIKPSGLMVNIDKGDYFLEEVYDLFIEEGMQHRIITKGHFRNYRAPTALRNALTRHQDLILSSYTPIVFDNNYPTKAEIDAWLNTPGFPGFEIIYKTDESPFITQKIYDGQNLINYVKSHGKRVGIFNESPDNCKGTWSSSMMYMNNVATSSDRRGEFEFLYRHGANFIVSDRVDLLEAFLKVVGKRSLN